MNCFKLRKNPRYYVLKVIKSEIESSADRFKLPSFDGKSLWTVFMKHFETLAKRNDQNDINKIEAVIIPLKNEATSILLILSVDELEYFKKVPMKNDILQ